MCFDKLRASSNHPKLRKRNGRLQLIEIEAKILTYVWTATFSAGTSGSCPNKRREKSGIKCISLIKEVTTRKAGTIFSLFCPSRLTWIYRFTSRRVLLLPKDEKFRLAPKPKVSRILHIKILPKQCHPGIEKEILRGSFSAIQRIYSYAFSYAFFMSPTCVIY